MVTLTRLDDHYGLVVGAGGLQKLFNYTTQFAKQRKCEMLVDVED